MQFIIINTNLTNILLNRHVLCHHLPVLIIISSSARRVAHRARTATADVELIGPASTSFAASAARAASNESSRAKSSPASRFEVLFGFVVVLSTFVVGAINAASMAAVVYNKEETKSLL